MIEESGSDAVSVIDTSKAIDLLGVLEAAVESPDRPLFERLRQELDDELDRLDVAIAAASTKE